MARVSKSFDISRFKSKVVMEPGIVYAPYVPKVSDSEVSGFPDSVMIDYYNQEFRRAIVANNPHKSYFTMMMALKLMSKRIKNLHCE